MNYRHHEFEFDFSVVLYDHSCNLCRREMSGLKRRDHLQRLLMVDISHPDFDQDVWGFDLETLNRALHVRTPEGEWLVGLPAVRHVYQQVGLGWIWWGTRLPVLSNLSDYVYKWFARNRYTLTGRACSSNTCPGPDRTTIPSGPGAEKEGAA
jgi:predicted DCC family thiol-disulfide oxidoreductase YuxK